MNIVTYPRLIRRVQAVLIDSVVVPVTVLATLLLGSELGLTQALAKAALILIPIFVLEPGLVAFTGGTIGHHLRKIRVTRTDGVRNINIFAATIRFLVKIPLGWLSFIFVLITNKHQAVHDLIAGSIVIHQKNTDGLPAHEVLTERKLDTTVYTYPPAWRRTLIIISYCVLLTVMVTVCAFLVSSAACLEIARCSTLDKLLQIILNILWIVGIGWIVVRGWNGRLYGCRKRQIGVPA